MLITLRMDCTEYRITTYINFPAVLVARNAQVKYVGSACVYTAETVVTV